MSKLKNAGAVLLALATLTPSLANAQWGGPGWHPWRERAIARPGWTGPVWHGVRGPHYGWYRYNNRFYRECGYRLGARGARVWVCR